MSVVHTILVTGASGFVGGWFLDAAARSEAFGTIQVPRLLGDPRTPAEIPTVAFDLQGAATALPAGIDTGVHLAGEKRDLSRMQAAHLSSVGVYGACNHAGRVDESCGHVSRHPYEASKDAGEGPVRERIQSMVRSLAQRYRREGLV